MDANTRATQAISRSAKQQCAQWLDDEPHLRAALGAFATRVWQSDLDKIEFSGRTHKHEPWHVIVRVPAPSVVVIEGYGPEE